MPRGDFPSTKQDQYMVRFPDGMRDQLKAFAERNKRSMNAEIVARLEDSIETSRQREQYAAEFDQMADFPLGADPALDTDMAAAIGKAVRSVLRSHGLEPKIADDPGVAEAQRNERLGQVRADLKAIDEHIVAMEDAGKVKRLRSRYLTEEEKAAPKPAKKAPKK